MYYYTGCGWTCHSGIETMMRLGVGTRQHPPKNSVGSPAPAVSSARRGELIRLITVPHHHGPISVSSHPLFIFVIQGGETWARDD
jgi:hypothetical protein